MSTYNVKLKKIDDERIYGGDFTPLTEMNIYGLTEILIDMRDGYAEELDTTRDQIEIISIELINEQRKSRREAINDIITDLIIYSRDEKDISRNYIMDTLQKLITLNK